MLFMKPKILILSDMEGCIGIYPDHDPKSFPALMCREVSILFDTLLEPGCFELYYCDCHNDGLMTRPLEDKYQDIKFLQNFWNIDFNPRFNYAFMTGFHAKNGPGISAHSFRNEFECIYINGTEIGEVGLFINWLAYHNITTLFVSGDDVMCREIDSISGLVANISKTADTSRKYPSSRCYDSYKDNIKKAITAIENTQGAKYSPSKIDLVFKKRAWKEAVIGREIEDDSLIISYENTVEFMEALYPISQKLNQEISLRYSFIRRLKKMLKNCDRSRIHDRDLLNLLENDFWNISHSDMGFIEESLRSLYNADNN